MKMEYIILLEDFIKDLFIIDIESTCWKNKKEQRNQISEIIEIGISKIEGNKITKFPSIFIKPQYSKISNFCTQLTTIEPKLIEKKGLDPKEAFQKLNKIVKSEAWGSWGLYDDKQFKRMFKLYNFPNILPKKHINIKHLFGKHILGKDDPYVAGNVKNSMEKIGLSWEGTHHRANDDSYNIAKVYKYLKGTRKDDFR